MALQIIKKAKLTLILTVVFSVLSSLSLSLIPLTSGIEKDGSNVLAYLLAVLFWGGIIASLTSASITKKKLRKYREKLIADRRMNGQLFPGIFSFSLNPKSIILYSLILAGIVLIITDIIFSYVPEQIMFIILSVTVLLFALHCVGDGKYYKVYKIIKESIHNETSH